MRPSIPFIVRFPLGTSSGAVTRQFFANATHPDAQILNHFGLEANNRA